MLKNISVVIGLSILTLLTGCRKAEPLDTCMVKGTVKLDGQPIEGVNIIFNPTSNNGISAGGVSGAGGSYTLTAGANTPGTGAMAGNFIPTFAKAEAGGGKRPVLSAEESKKQYEELAKNPPKGPFGPDINRKITYIVPEKYGNVKTCGINAVNVEKGKTNVFDFELSTK